MGPLSQAPTRSRSPDRCVPSGSSGPVDRSIPRQQKRQPVPLGQTGPEHPLDNPDMSVIDVSGPRAIIPAGPGCSGRVARHFLEGAHHPVPVGLVGGADRMSMSGTGGGLLLVLDPCIRPVTLRTSRSWHVARLDRTRETGPRAIAIPVSQP